MSKLVFRRLSSICSWSVPICAFYTDHANELNIFINKNSCPALSYTNSEYIVQYVLKIGRGAQSWKQTNSYSANNSGISIVIHLTLHNSENVMGCCPGRTCIRLPLRRPILVSVTRNQVLIYLV